MSSPKPPDLIDLALAEDIGSGDITSQSFIATETQARAKIVAREACILAGIETSAEIFRRVDSSLEITTPLANGSALNPGTSVLEVSGSARSILTAERTALNFLQRLSGVATLTRTYANAISGTAGRLLDTRKTTPGFRLLEKAAVLAGGGTNHRIGLYDQVLIKDNHLAATPNDCALQHSIEEILAHRPDLKIEIEADTLDQVARFVRLKGVHIILLDNMTNDQLRAAVALRRNGIVFEASGGVNLQTIRGIAETGVDFISVGALTHSALAVDFGLDFE